MHIDFIFSGIFMGCFYLQSFDNKISAAVALAAAVYSFGKGIHNVIRYLLCKSSNITITVKEGI